MSDGPDSELALRERVAALKHDLGKYVAWMSANLDERAWTGPVDALTAESLRRDLLRTRTNAHGAHEAAWDVWDRARAELSQISPSLLETAPELERVREAVESLRALEPVLRASDAAGLGPHRATIRAAQQTIRRELRGLHRRLARAAAR